MLFRSVFVQAHDPALKVAMVHPFFLEEGGTGGKHLDPALVHVIEHGKDARLDRIAAFAFGLAQVYFIFFIVIPVMRGKGEKAPQKPWEGADSLEWTHLPTPVPYHSFETPPVLK